VIPAARSSNHPWRDRLNAWLSDRPDDHILRWLFSAMVAVTVVVIALDYMDLREAALQQPDSAPSLQSEPSTATPSPKPLPARRGSERRPGNLRVSDKQLASPMTFELGNEGRLIATGTIDQGAADRFKAEIDKRGSYVKTVVLHSPGGSVQDALRIGRLIRERKYNTEVENGTYCASSCPLVFAGGVERIAAPKAAIGVHQIFAVAATAGATLADGMTSAQKISAECQRYLRDMGVDLQVWLHAMETGKDELYYFRPDELHSLKLATKASGPAS